MRSACWRSCFGWSREPWVGIPDPLFGVSAPLVAALDARSRVGRRFLFAWSLTGAAMIMVPTFGLLPYWMHEPGFSFIFEFPMVIAPGIIVPILVLLNALLAWRAFVARRSLREVRPASR